MFIMDMPPNAPQQYAQVVIAQAEQPKNSTKTERTIGVCQLVGINPDSVGSTLSPAGEVWSYFKQKEHITLDESIYRTAKISLLQASLHGKLEYDEATQSFIYIPDNPEYMGSDRATLLVEIGIYKVKVEYFFKLMEHVPSGTQGDPYTKDNCPKNTRIWKISLDANGNQVLNLVNSAASQTDAINARLDISPTFQL